MMDFYQVISVHDHQCHSVMRLSHVLPLDIEPLSKVGTGTKVNQRLWGNHGHWSVVKAELIQTEFSFMMPEI